MKINTFLVGEWTPQKFVVGWKRFVFSFSLFSVQVRLLLHMQQLPSAQEVDISV